MSRFADHFGIGLTQPELDFVDIPLEEDRPVYLDPFAVSLYDDDLSVQCNDTVVGFFQATISGIQSGDNGRAERMLQRLSEPNETHLGVSSGPPQGRGVSGKQAFDLYKSIVSSKAAKSGLVSELSECDLFINGIGPDKLRSHLHSPIWCAGSRRRRAFRRLDQRPITLPRALPCTTIRNRHGCQRA
jgi:hypothetical protein